MSNFKDLEKFIKEYQEKSFKNTLKEHLQDRNVKEGEIKHFENFEVKAASIDVKNLTLEVVATKQVVDRQGDMVMVNGIDASFFMRNPVVPFGHDYKALPVAKGIGIKIEGDELLIKLQFTPEELYEFGYKVFKMFEGGFLRAVSIGFIPVKMAWDDELKATVIEKSELLEVSVVPVPANQEALVKAYDVISKEEENKEPEETPEQKEQRKEANKQILIKYRKFQVLLRDTLGIEASDNEEETLEEVSKATLSFVKIVKDALNKHLEESEENPTDSNTKSKQEANRPVETKTSLASRALKMADKL